MPKARTIKTRSPGEKILDVMAYHQSRLELSHKEWAVKIAIPYNTLLRREKRPEEFTVGELMRVACVCEVPLGDLVSGKINE